MSGSMLGTAVGSAVVMLVGDKTQLGNEWYLSVVRQIEGTMIGECGTDTSRASARR